MRVTDKELRQYLKSISDLLLCKPKKRKQFMSDFSNSIDDFLQNNSDASINDLEKALGTPQEIAEEFMADISPQDIKKRFSITRIAIIPITLGVLIIVAVCIILIINSYKIHNSHENVYIIDKGTIYEDETTSSSMD